MDSADYDETAPAESPASDNALLQIQGLRTHFKTPLGVVHAVDGVNLSVAKGETLGLVGESGSGKTVLARSIMRLFPKDNVISEGQIDFEGSDLMMLRPDQLRHIYGPRIAMVFQDPMTSLHPVLKIGFQITEGLRWHKKVSKADARSMAIELLRSVHISEPISRLDQYPHELSGGMRQRVMIAIAIACGPALLLADEPTTALDVTVQAQILDLLEDQQRQHRMAMVFTTHDLGVVATRTHTIAVMYAGKIVEKATTRGLFAQPLHPYTEGLILCMPRLGQPKQEQLRTIAGQPPSLIDPTGGCRFAPRCPYVKERCRIEEPPLRTVVSGHEVACWYPVGSLARQRTDEGCDDHGSATVTSHSNEIGL
ncbi:MAG TPA: ABC transporter ATP-binding protein [Acidimicrobiales bacterium]|nr:ABC transporter ATP-binding protein [Acidimicrobiales bacterium]